MLWSWQKFPLSCIFRQLMGPLTPIKMSYILLKKVKKPIYNNGKYINFSEVSSPTSVRFLLLKVEKKRFKWFVLNMEASESKWVKPE